MDMLADKPNLENLKVFLKTVKTSNKAKALGGASIKEYYQFLTGKKPWTKKFQDTKKFRDWKFNVWRPFSKTLTNKNWEDLGVYPSIGREGMIALFRYQEDD